MKITILFTNGILPVKKYGGTERVVWDLAKGLCEKNHQVTIIAKKESKTDFAKIIGFDPSININKQIPEDTDVVHVNDNTHEDVEKPNLFTLHGNIFDNNYSFNPNTVFVSKSHAKRYNSSCFVYNGIDWDVHYRGFKVNTKKEKYFHFLGKARWKVKNAIGAYRIAEKCKKELKVLGGNRFDFHNIKYGSRYVISPKINFLGMVSDDVKRKIISKSQGLIFPVKWHEPFGLALTESLFLGSPVFGSKYGSLPEIINEQVGFLSNEISELSDAVNDLKFDSKVCHQYAKENFNSEKMTESYFELYEKVFYREKLNAEKPFF